MTRLGFEVSASGLLAACERQRAKGAA